MQENSEKEQQKLQKYKQLTNKFTELQQTFKKHQTSRILRKQQKKQQLQQLHDTIQQKTIKILYKIQQLKKKQTILLTILKIQPQIIQSFPKNYYCQINYQDVSLIGNQKFVDFDQNIIQQKFVLPLLSSTIAKIQIMTAQDSPTIFDKISIDLQKDVQNALINQKYQTKAIFQNNENLSLVYTINLQGIGFQSWLKTLAVQRELEAQRNLQFKLNEEKATKNKKKMSQKKQKFNKMFTKNHNKNPTKKYDQNEINSILNLLQD